MIYNNFISSQSPNQVRNIHLYYADYAFDFVFTSQVNLDHETRLNIHKRVELKNFHQGMFDRAQRRIQYMMEQDSYARFRGSDLFIRAIELLKIKNSK